MPLDSPGPAKNQEINDGLFEALLARLSERDRTGFTARQLHILETACQNVAWGRHPVDIRLSIPTIFSRVYMVFLMGKERRSARRRREERRRHAFDKLLNYIFVGSLVAAGIYGLFFIQALTFMVSYSDGAN